MWKTERVTQIVRYELVSEAGHGALERTSLEFVQHGNDPIVVSIDGGHPFEEEEFSSLCELYQTIRTGTDKLKVPPC